MVKKISRISSIFFALISSSLWSTNNFTIMGNVTPPNNSEYLAATDEEPFMNLAKNGENIYVNHKGIYFYCGERPTFFTENHEINHTAPQEIHDAGQRLQKFFKKKVDSSTKSFYLLFTNHYKMGHHTDKHNTKTHLTEDDYVELANIALLMKEKKGNK